MSHMGVFEVKVVGLVRCVDRIEARSKDASRLLLFEKDGFAIEILVLPIGFSEWDAAQEQEPSLLWQRSRGGGEKVEEGLTIPRNDPEATEGRSSQPLGLKGLEQSRGQRGAIPAVHYSSKT